jgi:hypothetical protein
MLQKSTPPVTLGKVARQITYNGKHQTRPYRSEG